MRPLSHRAIATMLAICLAANEWTPVHAAPAQRTPPSLTTLLSEALQSEDTQFVNPVLSQHRGKSAVIQHWRSETGAIDRRLIVRVAAAGTAGIALWKIGRAIFGGSSERSISDVIGTVPEPSKARVERYFQTTRTISTGSWRDADAAFFRFNELDLEEVVQKVRAAPGDMVGIGLQESLLFAGLIQGRYVAMDINPMISEVAIPFFGLLQDLCQSPREIVSVLMGMDITPEEFQAITIAQSANETQDWLLFKEILRRIAARESRSVRQDRINAAYGLIENNILPNLHLDAKTQARVRTEFLEWFGTERFNIDTALYSWDLERHAYVRTNLPGMLFAHRRVHLAHPDVDTFLTSDRGLARWQDAWRNNRVIGGTGDITGPIMDRTGEWLRGQGEAVGAVYIGNVHSYIEEAHRSAREIYAALAKLPLLPQTIVVRSQLGDRVLEPPTEFPGPIMRLIVDSFARARWIFEYIQSGNERTVFPAMMELPMAASREAVRSVVNTLRLVLLERGTAEAAIEREIALFEKLGTAILGHPDDVRALTPETFPAWAARQAPGLNAGTDYFRAYVAFLVETERLQPSPSESQWTPKPPSGGAKIGLGRLPRSSA